MTITVESRDGWHYATLAENDRGVAVTIWRWTQRGREETSIAKRIDEWLLDCPFHVACNAVHEIVWPLRKPVLTQRRHR